jgi:hypothetical protein
VRENKTMIGSSRGCDHCEAWLSSQQTAASYQKPANNLDASSVDALKTKGFTPLMHKKIHDEPRPYAPITSVSTSVIRHLIYSYHMNTPIQWYPWFIPPLPSTLTANFMMAWLYSNHFLFNQRWYISSVLWYIQSRGFLLTLLKAVDFLWSTSPHPLGTICQFISSGS